MSKLLAEICAKSSKVIWKPGARLKTGGSNRRNSGLPSKFRRDVAKLPSVSGERVIRAWKPAGFVELRQKGSHVSLEKRTAEIVFRTVVTMHSALAKGPLADLLKQSGLTLDEFLELL